MPLGVTSWWDASYCFAGVVEYVKFFFHCFVAFGVKILLIIDLMIRACLVFFVRFIILVTFVSWNVVLRFWIFVGGEAYEILGLVWGGKGYFAMTMLLPQLRLIG